MSDETKARKTSSVRHTRAIQRDRSKRPTSAPPDEEGHAGDRSQAGLAASRLGTPAHVSCGVVLSGADGDLAADAATLANPEAPAFEGNGLGAGTLLGCVGVGWLDVGCAVAQGRLAARRGRPGLGRSDRRPGQRCFAADPPALVLTR